MRMANKSKDIIKQWIIEIKSRDIYWKSKADLIYEKKLSLTDPITIIVNNIRQALRFYIIPFLENALGEPIDKQNQIVKFLEVLGNMEKFDQFLEHFFQTIKTEATEWIFSIRDPYQHDCYVLYDLFKSKLLINHISALQKEIEVSGASFPSVFDKSTQLIILKRVKTALLLTFRQSIKSKYQNRIFKEIGIEIISPKQIETRKANQVIFAQPDINDNSPYRRIFLHLLFKNNITTQWKGKTVAIQYDFINFEHLKYEYLRNWACNLKDKTEKLSIYKDITLNNTPFIEALSKNPQLEFELLNQLPLDTFNSTIAKISERVTLDEKPILEPITDDGGIIKELNSNFQSAITKLKGGLSSKKGLIKKVLQKLENLSELPPNSRVSKPTSANKTSEALLKKFSTSRLIYKKYTGDVVQKEKIAIVLGTDLPQQLKENLLQEEIIKASKVEIIYAEDVNHLNLEKYDFIMTVRYPFPKADNKMLKTHQGKNCFAEIIDVEALFDHRIFSDLGKGFSNLFDELDIIGIKKSQQDNRITSDRKIWEFKQALSEIDVQIDGHKRTIKHKLPHYLSIIQWLVLEIFLDQGHLKKLVPALLSVNQYLIIDAFKELSSNYLHSIGFNKKLISSWGRKELKKSIEEFQSTSEVKKVPINKWLKQVSFNRFELVIYIDWENFKPDVFPVFIRVKKVQSESKNGDSIKIFYFNLFTFFTKHFDFLNHYRYREKELGFSIENIVEFPNLKTIKQIRSTWKTIDLLESQKEKLQDGLEKLESEINKDNSESYSFLKQEYFINRISLLLQAYSNRSASLIVVD
jgi:hypothetical protein